MDPHKIETIRSANLLSIGEVADRAGLAESTIRTYRTRGQVPEPDLTIGTTPGWLPETIDPWIAELPGRGTRTDIQVADRLLLRAALEILLRDGISSLRPEQLMQGMRDGVTITAVARRVQIGAKSAKFDKLGRDDADLLRRAMTRATTLLRDEEQP